MTTPETLPAGMPAGFLTSGLNGYWGASGRTAELTTQLTDAIRTGTDRSGIIHEIDEELGNERCPTVDELDDEEDAYWPGQL